VAGVQQISLGYNNVYVVDDGGGRVLIDTGPDYRGAREHLQAELAGKPPGIVVATHGHLDHAGLGHWWRSSGTPVAIGEGDLHFIARPQLQREAEWQGYVSFVEQSGAPEDVAVEVLHGLEERRAWSRRASTSADYPPATRERRWPTGLRYHPFSASVTFSEDGALAESSSLEVVMCPGHTPGNLVVVHRREGWLFSGDQLLPDLTPTPGIQAKGGEHGGDDWRFRSLPAFVRSLRRLRDLDIGRCFPGHGEPFDDVAAAVAANLDQIDQRTERVLQSLREDGPGSLFAVCERLYPRAVRRRFWQIAATVQGHLDLLVEAGEVVVEGATFRALR
jgi:glyoxylase-like metal-dependent hydrolase (beta-lactamase superfamily II)